MIQIFDLFCGMGGGSEGVMRMLSELDLSAEVTLGVDADTNAARIFAARFPASAVWTEDVRTAGPAVMSMIRPEAITLLIAGPPCQGHSPLNNRTRGDDPRNSLYRWTVSHAIEVGYDFVIIENVRNIVHSQGDPIGAAEVVLASAGYATRRVLLRGEDVGVAQRRRRLFLVASRRPLDGFEVEVEVEPAPTCGEVLARPLPADGARGIPRLSKANLERMAWMHAKSGRFRVSHASGLLPPSHGPDRSHTDAYGRMDPDDYAPTITGNSGTLGAGRFGHPTEPRLCSLRELARLQDFPDDFPLPTDVGTTATRKALGNAIPPGMTAAIIRTLFA